MAGDDSQRSAEVPVYNCHVLLSLPDAEGWIGARSSNLSEAAARGRTQREALAGVVAAFKAAVRRYLAAGQEIPWTAPPVAPQPGDQERWVAVYL